MNKNGLKKRLCDLEPLISATFRPEGGPLCTPMKGPAKGAEWPSSARALTPLHYTPPSPPPLPAAALTVEEKYITEKVRFGSLSKIKDLSKSIKGGIHDAFSAVITGQHPSRHV